MEITPTSMQESFLEANLESGQKNYLSLAIMNFLCEIGVKDWELHHLYPLHPPLRSPFIITSNYQDLNAYRIRLFIRTTCQLQCKSGRVKRIQNLIINLPTGGCPDWDWFCRPMTSRKDGKSKLSSLSEELHLIKRGEIKS